MLPGFRFLFAAILLSTSLLVFGLGAAALLRAAHEEFSSNPSWRTGPQEQVFARQGESREAILAALRVDPQSAEPKPPEPMLAATQPEVTPPPAIEPDAAVVATPETEAQPDNPKVETVDVTESTVSHPAIGLALQHQPDGPLPEPEAVANTPGQARTPADDVEPVAVEEALAAAELAAPAAPQPAPDTKQAAHGSPPTSPDAAATKTAALGDAAVAAGQESQMKEKSAVKKRVHRRKRHRVVRRPLPEPVQPVFDPFAPQQVQPAVNLIRQTR